MEDRLRAVDIALAAGEVEEHRSLPGLCILSLILERPANDALNLCLALCHVVRCSIAPDAGSCVCFRLLLCCRHLTGVYCHVTSPCVCFRCLPRVGQQSLSAGSTGEGSIGSEGLRLK